jgi:acyl dehydratase
MATRELDSPPGLRGLYPKALAGTVLELPRKLPGLGRGGEPELPDEELVVSGIEVDREHLAHYDRVCGFRVRDELPPTYPHMIGFPLQMKLMTQRSFPFPVIGLVHVRNRIEQTRPLRADEELTVAVRAENLQEGDKGTSFEMVGEASVGDETVWRSSSTYLRRGNGGGSSEKKKSKPPTHPDAIWKLGGDVGRRYASVSGDINPIHLHPISARLFGFPKPIAHGMWLKARCLAALEGEVPDACSIDVSFKLPLLLPAKVAFSSRPKGPGRAFDVVDARNGKPHLSGTVGPKR